MIERLEIAKSQNESWSHDEVAMLLRDSMAASAIKTNIEK
jgi:hypothetical protein